MYMQLNSEEEKKIGKEKNAFAIGHG